MAPLRARAQRVSTSREQAGQGLHVSSAPRAASAPPRWPSISPPCWRSASRTRCCSIWIGSPTTSPCSSAPSPQYTLIEVGENLTRMDQALFEGFVTRDPLGFFLVGPPDALEHRGLLHRAHVPRVRHLPGGEVRLHRDRRRPRHLRRSGAGGLPGFEPRSSWCCNQDFPSIRNAQRYIASLMRMGFNQDQIKVVVNHYSKKVGLESRQPGTDSADAESAGLLRHSVIAGDAGVDQPGPPVGGQTASRRATWTASSARLSTRPPARSSKRRSRTGARLAIDRMKHHA